jgi:hypothetical protein
VGWNVQFTKKSAKLLLELPEAIQNQMDFLRREIEVTGPMQPGWKNFGKLKGSPNLYHCHLKSGRPTYVVCWAVADKNIRLIEVYYVGTHEKAPY